ncbi:MAG: DUF1566 domain-containing protein [Gammaproteobacteria bacterium]|nr:DUF1566 domain-containing protein [Gammaproteobacteria bacterium]NIR98263.1 DUF1566 domain-containing protein [Gammaproteobacteria bacterium]NIT63938.1 DUF1566 domain-containing protein [Gammaproteobacteria bacterium]NIV20936.1 DUF1566 domain-containing protein [Gammaproteobacteria bacterium]NIX10228.1 DUF1566 domain-containing protein [Gammaproteobacteria bacterium]
MGRGYVQTGQRTCHGADGGEIPCVGSGQDGETRAGLPWPDPRFETHSEVVHDRLTGLTWTCCANPAEFPFTWQEALDYVRDMNRGVALGHADWRLPNRRELRSLVSHQTRQPALPEGHPFQEVFAGWYWTSTSAAIAPAHAWYVDLGGGRAFYGGKDQSFLLWPVRGSSKVLPVTGQDGCYDARGRAIACPGSGQDGEGRYGLPWPAPRFTVEGDTALDRLTGLRWWRRADVALGQVTWAEALTAVHALNRYNRGRQWRLPNINELESLVDSARHGPALPAGHPFRDTREVYWSSTTSLYAPDWAWALYLDKGAVGVGRKPEACFNVWAVAES